MVLPWAMEPPWAVATAVRHRGTGLHPFPGAVCTRQCVCERTWRGVAWRGGRGVVVGGVVVWVVVVVVVCVCVCVCLVRLCLCLFAHHARAWVFFSIVQSSTLSEPITMPTTTVISLVLPHFVMLTCSASPTSTLSYATPEGTVAGMAAVTERRRAIGTILLS
jgi:hypothetical protein